MMGVQKGIKTRKMNMNEGWKFSLQQDFVEPIHQDFDDSKWHAVHLPHDWSIEFDFNIKHSIVGSEAGYLDGGIGWYRKQFVLPKQFEGKCISIQFGGVYMDSTVYVNGVQVGKYPNGYTPFSYDLTDLLVADGQTINTLVVKVVNQQPSSRWYSGSGIYRNVNLVVTDPVHIVEYGTFIKAPKLEEEYSRGKGTFEIATEVKNMSTTTQSVTVRHSVCDYATKECIAQSEEQVQDIEKAKVQWFNTSVTILNPKLWTVDTPCLYTVYTEVIVDGRVIDTYESRTGFRWLTFDNNHGFSLNGEWMKLKGVCMHHDQGALGAVANRFAIERQMKIMKEMGANAIRVAHNPAADELLEVCDELGLMVIDEAFDTWYGSKKQYDLGRFFSQPSMSHPEGSPVVSWAEFDVKRMVKRGRNFPCIISWSVGNEVWEASGDERSMKVIKNFNKWVEEVDSTRGITQGVDKFRFGNGQGEHEKIADYQQTVGFNYAEANYDEMHKKHPEWVIYGSETSSATKSRGVYAHPDVYGKHDSGDHPDFQQSSYDNDHVGWGGSATNTWIADRDRAYILGQFIWTGFDYIGEPTPWHNTGGAGHEQSPKSSYFGIVDTAGFPKDDYYLYQSVWKSVEEAPMVHILPHWNWSNPTLLERVKGIDGLIPIRVYSNAPQVELFVNGISQGAKTFAEKQTNYGFKYQQQSEESDRLYLEWRLPYSYKEGTTIKAVASTLAGETVAVDEVTTAGVANHVELTPNHTSIVADGTQLCYITVEVRDEKGNKNPVAHEQIYFELCGDAQIVGVDNGNAVSHERYKAQHDGTWQRQLFNGKALVIVQAGTNAGIFKLRAWGEGIASKEVAIEMLDKSQEAFNQHSIFKLEEVVNALNTQTESVEDSQGKIQDKVQKVYTPLAIEGMSLAMVEGMGINLPSKVVVYYTHGLILEKDVQWESTDFMMAKDFTNTYCEVKGRVEGIELVAKANIRIIKQAEQMRWSHNYAKQWTGSQFPAAIASYTNSTQESTDQVSYINDTVIAFEEESTNRWTNKSDNVRKEDWVGILFAEGGNITRRYIDTLRVGFIQNHLLELPKALEIEYYIGEVEPSIPEVFGNVTDGDLAKDEYWKKVDKLVGEDQLQANTMSILSFAPVRTYAIRLRFQSSSEQIAVGITELEAYGKLPLRYGSFHVTSIQLGEKELLETFNQIQTVIIEKSRYEEEIKVEVTQHAKVTVIPATKDNLETTIYIVPEDGDIGETQVYQIQFR